MVTYIRLIIALVCIPCALWASSPTPKYTITISTADGTKHEKVNVDELIKIDAIVDIKAVQAAFNYLRKSIDQLKADKLILYSEVAADRLTTELSEKEIAFKHRYRICRVFFGLRNIIFNTLYLMLPFYKAEFNQAQFLEFMNMAQFFELNSKKNGLELASEKYPKILTYIHILRILKEVQILAHHTSLADLVKIMHKIISQLRTKIDIPLIELYGKLCRIAYKTEDLEKTLQSIIRELDAQVLSKKVTIPIYELFSVNIVALAAYNNNNHLLKLLFEKFGFNPNAWDSVGVMPLFLPESAETKALLEPIDVQMVDNDGYNALQVAIESIDEHAKIEGFDIGAVVTELLLEKGADINQALLCSIKQVKHDKIDNFFKYGLDLRKKIRFGTLKISILDYLNSGYKTSRHSKYKILENLLLDKEIAYKKNIESKESKQKTEIHVSDKEAVPAHSVKLLSLKPVPAHGKTPSMVADRKKNKKNNKQKLTAEDRKLQHQMEVETAYQLKIKHAQELEKKESLELLEARSKITPQSVRATFCSLPLANLNHHLLPRPCAHRPVSILLTKPALDLSDIETDQRYTKTEPINKVDLAYRLCGTIDQKLAREIYKKHKVAYDASIEAPRCIPEAIRASFEDGTIDPVLFSKLHGQEIASIAKDLFKDFAKKFGKATYTEQEKIGLLYLLITEKICRGCLHCFYTYDPITKIKKITLPPYLKNLEKEV